MSSDKRDVEEQVVDTPSSPSPPVPVATPSPSLPHHHYPSRPSYSSSTSSLERFRSLAAASDLPPSPPIAIALEAPIGPTDDDAFDPPDGGLRAWSQVFAAHLINAMTWGYAGSFGVYQLYYEQHLDLPASQVSWIGSVQIFLTFATCALSGRLSDAGYARATACTGCFLAVLGSFMTSLSTEYWQFLLAQGVCVGLGLGIAFMPGVSVMSSYFKRNRPFALSVAAMGTSLGGVVFPATVQYVTPKLGFHWAARCAAFIALVFSVTACLLLRPYLPARKAGPWVEWAAFRERTYLLFSLGCFLNFYAMYFGFFYASEPRPFFFISTLGLQWAIAYARNKIGFSTLESINLLLITNCMGIPFRPLAGFLANNFFGPINVFIGATTGVSILLFSWAGVSTRAGMYAFSVFYGIVIGANQATFVSALASLTGDPRKMGTRFGMIETLSSFATLAGTPTAGAIIDTMGGRYLVSQLWAGAVMAAAVVVFVCMRISLTGLKLRVKV